jgi:PTS system fructose-specific IIA component
MINSNLIYINQSFVTKDEILDFLTSQAEIYGLIKDKKEYLSAIYQRENEISTAIGYDLAVPHGESKTVIQPFLLFLRLKNSIIWTNGNENTVKMVFLLGIPETGGDVEHLKMLAQISRKLMDENYRKELLNCNDPERIAQIINDVSE